MLTQSEERKNLRALHARDGAFIIPVLWDIGTARLLAYLGFEALATTSAGYAFSVGQRDNTIDRDMMIRHVADIVSATELPWGCKAFNQGLRLYPRFKRVLHSQF